MIQLILYFIQLIFSSICLFVNKSSKNVALSDISEDTPVSSPKVKANGAKKKKPKRNRSAFIIFSSEKRALLKAQNGELLNSNEMMVKLADLWRILPEDEKRVYHEEADKEKARYLHDLNQFYVNNPNETIQNKTKKNHIKKPCSAYALFLKETKKSIKLDYPDKKMADILKVVAEKWRALPDNIRVHFQQKALAEKELTQAKMSEYLSKVDEPAPQKKKSSPKKNSKKSPNSLKESIKFEDITPEHSSKYHCAPSEFQLEEPALKKRPFLNISIQQPSYQTTEFDYYFSEIQAIARTASQEGMQRALTELGLQRDVSNIWKSQAEVPQLTSMFSNDTIDLMNFQTFEEPVAAVKNYDIMVKEEEQTTEATYMSPRSLTGRMNANDLLVNILDSDSSSFDQPMTEEEMWTDFIKI